jgi:hypothetical protein
LPQPLIDDDVRFVGETLGFEADRLMSSLHLLSPDNGDESSGSGAVGRRRGV